MKPDCVTLKKYPVSKRLSKHAIDIAVNNIQAWNILSGRVVEIMAINTGIELYHGRIFAASKQSRHSTIDFFNLP